MGNYPPLRSIFSWYKNTCSNYSCKVMKVEDNHRVLGGLSRMKRDTKILTCFLGEQTPLEGDSGYI